MLICGVFWLVVGVRCVCLAWCVVLGCVACLLCVELWIVLCCVMLRGVPLSYMMG